MPLKSGPNKGELTAAEIRKLIRGHNIGVTIKVPPGLDRDGLIKFLKDRKFEIDHVKQQLIDKRPERGKSISLEVAKARTKPVPKTEEQKQSQMDKKVKKAKETKEKEDSIKAEGVKQGAALQRVIAKKKAKKPKAPVAPEPEDPEDPEVLELEDKPKEEWKFNKAMRARLNRDFKKKFGKTANKVLGLGLDPSPKEVKEACRKLKVKNHPDRGGDADTFISIQEACELLVSTFR